MRTDANARDRRRWRRARSRERLVHPCAVRMPRVKGNVHDPNPPRAPVRVFFARRRLRSRHSDASCRPRHRLLSGRELADQGPIGLRRHPQLLKEAIDFAIAGETKAPRDLALNHYQTFGREPFGYAIGPIKERGDPTGLVVHLLPLLTVVLSRAARGSIRVHSASLNA